MSKTKFTPGPWVSDLRGGCCAVYPASKEADSNVIQSSDERNIFYSSKNNSFDGISWTMCEEAQANAALIAAAPEMYEMIESLASELNSMIEKENERLRKSISSTDLDPPDYYDQESIHEAFKLLSKARGES